MDLGQNLDQFFLQLLKKHRNSITSNLEQKQEINNRKQELDSQQLQISNLQFEQEYLKEQIRLCRDYEPVFKRLGLMDMEHAEMMEQLKREKESRLGYIERLNECKRKKQEWIDLTQQKKRQLEHIDNQVQYLIKQSKDLQTKLGIDLSELQTSEQASLLPEPLFVLYKRCLGLDQTVRIIDATENEHYPRHALGLELLIGSAVFQFYYLPDQTLVITSIQSVFPTSYLAIFDDQGLDSPNPKISDFEPSSAGGLAYQWAQAIISVHLKISIPFNYPYQPPQFTFPESLDPGLEAQINALEGEDVLDQQMKLLRTLL
ncbi:hypothetical protein EDD86DRAFT_248296 [Gorgonomyces haynaldii]|nr:hypothetical protein EDD86DRAFT_248296 [Gorgonomyces haynaldii]